MDVTVKGEQNAPMINCLSGCARELATMLELAYTVPEMKAVAPEAIGYVTEARDLLLAAGATIPEEIDHLLQRLVDGK